MIQNPLILFASLIERRCNERGLHYWGSFHEGPLARCLLLVSVVIIKTMVGMIKVEAVLSLFLPSHISVEDCIKLFHPQVFFSTSKKRSHCDFLPCRPKYPGYIQMKTNLAVFESGTKLLGIILHSTNVPQKPRISPVLLHGLQCSPCSHSYFQIFKFPTVSWKTATYVIGKKKTRRPVVYIIRRIRAVHLRIAQVQRHPHNG